MFRLIRYENPFSQQNLVREPFYFHEYLWCCATYIEKNLNTIRITRRFSDDERDHTWEMFTSYQIINKITNKIFKSNIDVAKIDYNTPYYTRIVHKYPENDEDYELIVRISLKLFNEKKGEAVEYVSASKTEMMLATVMTDGKIEKKDYMIRGYFNTMLTIGGMNIRSNYEHLKDFSSVFLSILNYNDEVAIGNISADEFYEFLNVMDPKCDKRINGKNLRKMINIAKKLDMKGLENACLHFLRTSKEISTLERYNIALKYKKFDAYDEVFTAKAPHRQIQGDEPRQARNIFVIRNISKLRDKLRIYTGTCGEKEFEWSMSFGRKRHKFILLTHYHSNSPWNVYVDYQFIIKSRQADLVHIGSSVFNNDHRESQKKTVINYESLIDVHNGYWSEKDDSICVDMTVTLNWAFGMTSFDDLNINNQTILLKFWDQEELVVDNYILADVSNWFFVCIVHEDIREFDVPMRKTEFMRFLSVVKPFGADVDVQNLKLLLRMAEKYEVPYLRKRCEEFLCETDEISLRDKIVYCFEHGLETLKTQCYRDWRQTMQSSMDINNNTQGPNDVDQITSSMYDSLISQMKNTRNVSFSPIVKTFDY